mmetsp:Transcript_6762/g.7611  ORF Transcript_6762/g.7611 Transcript_6762/m.7611 type:complete len:161 (-) Transcript_6762:147-629(-)
MMMMPKKEEIPIPNDKVDTNADTTNTLEWTNEMRERPMVESILNYHRYSNNNGYFHDNDDNDDEDDDDDNNDRKTFVAQFKKVKLCTSWDYGSTRGSLAMIEQCATNAKPTSTSTSTSSLQFTPYSTIHPFKMTTHGYEIWDRTFDYVTTGTSNIESKVV